VFLRPIPLLCTSALSTGWGASLLYAQANEVPSFLGSSAVAGLTAAGLLASVLAWVFGKHLPSKDRQINDLLTFSDNQLRAARADYKEALVVVAGTVNAVVALGNRFLDLEDRRREGAPGR
jgi:hypothetical protein